MSVASIHLHSQQIICFSDKFFPQQTALSSYTLVKYKIHKINTDFSVKVYDIQRHCKESKLCKRYKFCKL